MVRCLLYGRLRPPCITRVVSFVTRFKSCALRKMRLFVTRPVGAVDVVRPSQLSAFAARAAINAKESKAPSQTFTLIPGGKRPYYCLVDVEHARPGQAEIPIGLDL